MAGRLLSDFGPILCVGLVIEDTILNVPVLPSGGAKLYATARHVTGGGPASNAAVAIKRLGGSAVFAGRLGNDATGDRLEADLAAEGVHCQIRRYADIASPSSTILVDDTGERMIIAHTQPFPDVAENLGLPKDCSAVLADLSWPAGALAAVRAAAKMGLPSVIDADVSRHPPEVLLPILDAASHVVFSRAGLRALSDTADIADGLGRMARTTQTLLAVTDGERGTYVAAADEVVNFPALPVAAVDTTASGDAYHGALALALVRGDACETAIGFATRVAAMKCLRAGGRDGLPRLRDMMNFTEENQ